MSAHRWASDAGGALTGAALVQKPASGTPLSLRGSTHLVCRNFGSGDFVFPNVSESQVGTVVTFIADAAASLLMRSGEVFCELTAGQTAICTATTTTTWNAIRYGDLTVATADRLATLRLANGQVANLLGYYAVADGGGQQLVYRSSGRSGITVDNGWYFAGPGDDDYFEAIDKGVANVRRFGAKGDSDPDGSIGTDDTAAFESARAAIESTYDAIGSASSIGGGVIYVPRGCYAVNFYLTKNSVSRAAKLIGEDGGTYLTSYTSGGWAVAVDNNIFAFNPFTYPTIENIGFIGRRAGVDKISNGLNAGRRVNLRNVGFAGCLLGFVSTDNYYGVYRDCNFYGCDVAAILGTFGTGQGTISDLVDGNAATVSTTLAVLANSASGHSGNKVLDHWRINTCRFGLVLAGPAVQAPHLEIIKPTIEGCAVGLWARQGQAILRSPWFESNGQAGDLTLDGMTAPARAGIVCSAPSGLGTYDTSAGSVLVSGGLVGSSYVDSMGKLTVKDGAQMSAVPTVASGGSLKLLDVHADNLAFGFYIERPAPQYGGGRPINCWTTPKTVRVYNAQPPGGSVVIADDCTGAALTSTRLSNAGGVLTYEVAEGVFAEQKCIQYAAQTGQGWNLDMSGSIDTGKYYALVIVVNTPEAATFSIVNLSGTWGLATASVPADQWTAVCMVSRFSAAGGGSDPRWKVDALTGTQNLLFSGIQVIEFAALADAQAYCASPYFYMTEE